MPMERALILLLMPLTTPINKTQKPLTCDNVRGFCFSCGCYGIKAEHSVNVCREELAAVIKLIQRFLLKHFFMIAFLDKEIEPVRIYMKDWQAVMKSIVYEGETGLSGEGVWMKLLRMKISLD